MEQDILLICPLLFEIVVKHNMFLEFEFVVSSNSSELTVREMWEKMNQKATPYEIEMSCLVFFPVCKIRMERKE